MLKYYSSRGNVLVYRQSEEQLPDPGTGSQRVSFVLQSRGGRGMVYVARRVTVAPTFNPAWACCATTTIGAGNA